MPTSTDVTKLNINELTETQYDAAVLGGTIGANDLSFLTDVDIETQVSTMPAASADELGKVYQFIGTTDANYTHGYFYECVSDGATPPVYSWSNVQVQPGGSSYTAGTGIDITSGVISVTSPTVQNSAYGVGTSNLSILGNTINPVFTRYATSIGETSSVMGYFSIAVGYGAQANSGSVSIGGFATGNKSICVGTNKVTAAYAIQLGSCDVQQTNSDTNTFKVANNNGNFEIMSADGTVPADRLVNAINKYSTMPTAASTNEGWIVQYTGTTDSTYTHGYIYECVSDGGNPATYSWSAINVQAGGGGSSYTAGTGIDITSGTISTTIPLYVSNVGSYGDTSLGFCTEVYASKRACIFIGEYSGAGGTAVSVKSAINIGNSTSGSSYSITIGQSASTTSTAGHNICIGHNARVTGNQTQYAIQIGSQGGTVVSNPDSNTFKVANANGNFEIMSTDGTIPTDRYTTTPSADGTYVPTLTISSGVATRTWSAPSGGSPTTTTITLAVNDWSNNSQTVNVSGVTASNLVQVAPAPSSNSDYVSGGVLCTAQGSGTLTFDCTTTPTNAITVNVVIFG